MPVVPPLPTDAYLAFDHLCDYMQRVAEAVPHLVRLYTIGESFEGRPLMLAEVTNEGTGAAAEKPALWLDGNSRAGEVAGSMACLAVLQRLASGHGRDEWVTSLLDTRAFYLLPRMAPDGAEHVLATGEFVLGSRRSETHDTLRGLIPGDVNGDGRILQMRVEDPRGEWKVSRRDPRLMLRRSPDDRQGPFYRLYREGHVEGHAGGPVHVPALGLDRDLTRNFPGGVDDPLSEPETRAVADFLRTHRNLGAALSLRSSEGRIATPAAPVGGDAALLRQFAARASEITGYPAGPAARGGDFVDWAYGSLGLLSMTLSLWSLPRAAGLEVTGDERSETELLAVLRWLDREHGGQGFHPWTRFQHPQLGRVEIGGWDLLTTWLNPPPGDDLAEDCRRASELALALASSLPRLSAAEFREEQVGWADSEDGAEEEELSMPLPLRKIVLEVVNDGYLPTWLTEAGQRGAGIPALAEIVLSDGVELLLGSPRTDLGPLAGTGTVHASDESDPAWFGGRSEDQRRRLEWLVRGEGEVGVRVQHPRAGVVEAVSSGEETPQAAPTPPPPPAYAARIMAARSAAPPPAAPPPVAPPAPPAPARPAAAAPAAPTRPAAPAAGRPAAPAPAAARPAAPAATPPARPAAPAAGAARPAVPGQAPRPPARPAAAEPPLAPPAPASPGFRPAARIPPEAATDEAPRTVYRVTPPASAPGRGVTPAAAPPVMAEGGFTTREDSPLRKERTETATGRVLGAPPSRPGAAPGRPPAPVPPGRPPSPPPVARPPEPDEDMAPLVPPPAAETAARPRPLGGARPMESAPSAPPPAEEDLEAPPSASRIPAPLLLRRPRQPERKD